MRCGICGSTSFHPEDERQGYCGACHAFTCVRYVDRPQLVRGWTYPRCPVCDAQWTARPVGPLVNAIGCLICDTQFSVREHPPGARILEPEWGN